MRFLLISSYDLGRQPQAAAELAGLLSTRGHTLAIIDLSLTSHIQAQLVSACHHFKLDPAATDDPWLSLLQGCDGIVVFVSMLTSATLARQLLENFNEIVGLRSRIAFTGLYASSLNDLLENCDFGETYVHNGRQSNDLIGWLEGSEQPTLGDANTKEGSYRPKRDLLPRLELYKTITIGSQTKITGSLDTTVGCRHRCRHCPIPSIFDGRIQVHSLESIMDDIDNLVSAGAKHLSFGDPDFLNAPVHARKVIAELHRRHPTVTFDATVKVEHIIRHQDLWSEMADAGCLYVTSAIESFSPHVLRILDKGHTPSDPQRAANILDRHGIGLHPTFVPFTPWTTEQDIFDILTFLIQNDLTSVVEPVQLGIRLLIPPNSLLLEVPEVTAVLQGFDATRHTYHWFNEDARLDRLANLIGEITSRGAERGAAYSDTIDEVIEAAEDVLERKFVRPPVQVRTALSVVSSEPWFCCSEPTDNQRGALVSLRPRSLGASRSA